MAHTLEKPVALITGVTGQDGSYLAELLLNKGYAVHGLRRRNSTFLNSRIDHLLENQPLFHLHDGDMTDTSGLFALIKSVNPQEIYNLAAQSHVGVSFETPEYTANVDALGTLRLLEAIRQNLDLSITKFYQASTSEMFGNSPHPQNESTTFSPKSPYAVAKLYSHWITVNYRESYGIHASCGILFNHESSRRGPSFVSKKIINGLIRHKNDNKFVLMLGNLEAKRDWGHASEYVEAMWKILQLKEPVDLVIGTGKTYSVREFIEACCQRLNLKIKWIGSGEDEYAVTSEGNKIISVNKKYFRPSEVNHLEADAAAARSIIGWNPKIGLNELIEEMITETKI